MTDRGPAVASKAEWKRRLLSALAVTVINDVESLGAGYVYGDEGDVGERDRLRVESAARDLADEFLRRSRPRSVSGAAATSSSHEEG
jgi:hypothetical protein